MPVRVVVNGSSLLTDASTLAQLVETLGREPAEVATAVNGSFVALRGRGRFFICDGDDIEIVSARQGG